VKITLVPLIGSSDGRDASQFLTSYVINDCVAIDAGVIGFQQELSRQSAIRHIFLSHSHIDHLASLPMFLENVFGMNEAPVTLHAGEAVQECLRLDLFNGRLWPNFLELKVDQRAFVTLQTLRGGESVEVEGLRITPVAVHHVVPTFGFIIEDAGAAIVISSDTGPTEEIWQRARASANLKAVFLEATFPEAMTGLADVSRHLTTRGLVREMQKLGRPVPFFAVHLKARFRENVTRELLANRLPELQIAQFGTTYEF
jgi:ribonuclease BN (tRNA processing enzyme)